MTAPQIQASETSIHPLALRWQQLRKETPRLRQRDAAHQLGVTEAELVAAHVGTTATRLDTRWVEFLEGMEPVGPVTGLTRNPDVVIEATGTIRNVDIGKMMGVVLDEGLDLRVFLASWHVGFALVEETARGPRHSVQFFDTSGTAIFKMFLREESDVSALQALVARHRAENQSPVQELGTLAALPEEKPDAGIDVEGFLTAWDGLKDTHDFFGMLRKFGVTRTQALRLAESRWTVPVAPDAYRPLLTLLSETQLPFMTFVGNRGMIQIRTDVARRVKEVGAWFNILDPHFNLHIREAGLTQAWIVRKPTVDGIVTGVEFFNAQGDLQVTFFGKRKPGIPEDEAWRALVKTLEPLPRS
ncbi:MAG TPA: ChuX/HutX family heme-like substrate-binding protein [Myxococcaceae bacterium]|nr:ChuX/HutX family heme-like substrate-binding protein [Myxococcaceae bacterium]